VHDFLNDKKIGKIVVKTYKKKSTPATKGRSANAILSYKVGIKAHVEAVMTQCEADFKGEIFLKIVRSLTFETWVIVAIIILVLIYEKLIFTPLIYINATLFGFKKLGI
jgi:hypothetical protein